MTVGRRGRRDARHRARSGRHRRCSGRDGGGGAAGHAGNVEGGDDHRRAGDPGAQREFAQRDRALHAGRPGAQQRRARVRRRQMRIRGLRPDAAAVLVDGMRFRDASTIQADATSFLSTLNFVAADRVEVLRGSGSSLYGTNAVGGVVNIVTRPGGGAFRAEGAGRRRLARPHPRPRVRSAAERCDDRLRYSAGALQFNLLDGLDGHRRGAEHGRARPAALRRLADRESHGARARRPTIASS